MSLNIISDWIHDRKQRAEQRIAHEKLVTDFRLYSANLLKILELNTQVMMLVSEQGGILEQMEMYDHDPQNPDYKAFVREYKGNDAKISDKTRGIEQLHAENAALIDSMKNVRPF
jgi:hypothetical protein